MQTQNELNEILLEAYDAGYKTGTKENLLPFRVWYEQNESKILALGKQKPLAKNKQTQEQKFYPCAVELLSDGTEHCTVECLDKKNCEFLRADATSR